MKLKLTNIFQKKRTKRIKEFTLNPWVFKEQKNYINWQDLKTKKRIGLKVI